MDVAFVEHGAEMWDDVGVGGAIVPFAQDNVRSLLREAFETVPAQRGSSGEGATPRARQKCYPVTLCIGDGAVVRDYDAACRSLPAPRRDVAADGRTPEQCDCLSRLEHTTLIEDERVAGPSEKGHTHSVPAFGANGSVLPPALWTARIYWRHGV